MISITDLAAKQFDYSFDFKLIDIAISVINRAEEELKEISKGNRPYSDLWEITGEAIDSELVYCSNQWIVLQHYCTPVEADYSIAIDSFCEDVRDIAEAYVNELWREA